MLIVSTMGDLNFHTSTDVKVGKTFDSEDHGLHALYCLMFDHWDPLCELTGLDRNQKPWAPGYTVEWLLYKQNGSHGIVRGKWAALRDGLPTRGGAVGWPTGSVVVAHTHPLMFEDLKYGVPMFFETPVSHNPPVVGERFNEGVPRAMPSYGDLRATPSTDTQIVVAPYVYVPPNRRIAQPQEDISPVQLTCPVSDVAARQRRLDELREGFMEDRVFLCVSRWKGQRVVDEKRLATDLEFLGVSSEVRQVSVRGELTVTRISAAVEYYNFTERPW